MAAEIWDSATHRPSSSPAWVVAIKTKEGFVWGCRYCKAPWRDYHVSEPPMRRYELYNHEPECLVPLAQAAEEAARGG